MAKIRNYCNECGRLLHEYKRKLTQGAIQSFIGLNQLHLENPNSLYFHYREIINKHSGGLDYGLLQKFGLIVSNPSDSGKWAISELGNKFINGETSIPLYLYFYLGQIVKESPERIYFNQVSKAKFNLEEVMQEETK